MNRRPCADTSTTGAWTADAGTTADGSEDVTNTGSALSTASEKPIAQPAEPVATCLATIVPFSIGAPRPHLASLALRTGGRIVTVALKEPTGGCKPTPDACKAPSQGLMPEKATSCGESRVASRVANAIGRDQAIMVPRSRPKPSASLSKGVRVAVGLPYFTEQPPEA